jgi:hypothetical protein
MIPIANFEQHARKFLEQDLCKSLLAFVRALAFGGVLVR